MTAQVQATRERCVARRMGRQEPAMAVPPVMDTMSVARLVAEFASSIGVDLWLAAAYSEATSHQPLDRTGAAMTVS